MKVIVPREVMFRFLQSNKKILIGDANFFIPIGRNDINKPRQLSREQHLKHILDPFLSLVDKVYVQKSVIEEILDNKIVEHLQTSSKVEIIDYDSLDDNEKTMFNTIEAIVAPMTDYNPNIKRSKDKGEVHSISHGALLNLDFMITHDLGAVSILSEESVQVYTGSLRAIMLYEIIYYLSLTEEDTRVLKAVYKLMYYYTKNEKSINPSWGEFIELMNNTYAK